MGAPSGGCSDLLQLLQKLSRNHVDELDIQKLMISDAPEGFEGGVRSTWEIHSSVTEGGGQDGAALQEQTLHTVRASMNARRMNLTNVDKIPS
jgi:hypothetical protein